MSSVLDLEGNANNNKNGAQERAQGPFSITFSFGSHTHFTFTAT
jgi:hypothetical protein